ncbi:PLC-like phosphodiesterase [Coniella lustricola]|uniref:Phosphoinositide phospholipase C n=1 Tax=Coniella lustricola TaxID=2025994 RepID=A0A2T3A6M8_9PEZI|nr:PLC-like phosphodiesterase [Coniella lustricola]
MGCLRRIRKRLKKLQAGMSSRGRATPTSAEKASAPASQHTTTPRTTTTQTPAILATNSTPKTATATEATNAKAPAATIARTQPTSLSTTNIPKIGAPTPPTPDTTGPRPSPRFGAHTAWKHFFHVMALGSAPATAHNRTASSSSQQQQQQPHQSRLGQQNQEEERGKQREPKQGGGTTASDETKPQSRSTADLSSTTTAAAAEANDDSNNDDDNPSIFPTTTSDLPFLKESIRKHLEAVFSTLRGRAGDYILRERLQEFLIQTQGGLKRPLDKDIYTLGDFVYIWLHDYSAALCPPAKKDLSKPITNYFISSSHNTYIRLGNQLNGEVSADAYREVLEGDCRCVEIDVWNGEGWSAEARSRTPSRSKSPHTMTFPTPSPRHRRQLSSVSTLSASSIPAAAQSLVEKIDQKWRKFSNNVRDHSRSPSRSRNRSRGPSSNASASMSQLHLGLPPASYSTTSLDNGFLDPNDYGFSLRTVRSAESVTSRGRRSRSPSGAAELQPQPPPQQQQERRIEPEVTHAHTVQGLGDVGLARRIPLRDVCRVIRESAFKTNKLPVIISLEVHATGEQQDMIVDIMREEWGDHLLDMRLADCNPGERQPRLDELLEKILVKVKKPAVPPQPGSARSIGSGGGSISFNGSSQLTVPILHEDNDTGSDEERLMATATDVVVTTQNKSNNSNIDVSQQLKRQKTAIRQALGSLAIYTHSEHFNDFLSPEARSLSHIFSIDEYKILRLHQTKHRELFVHNRGFFMRAYPHSTRVSSTNLDPSLYWRKGVQMVALNWQRSHVDEAMMLNSAMFDAEQGWVLKPQGYLASDTTIMQAQAGWRRTLKRFCITILAGQLIPLPGEVGSDSDSSSSMSSLSTVDSSSGFKPFIKCELHVETPEERNEKKAIKSGLAQDGLYKLVSKCSETENPDWGLGQVLEFPPIRDVVEELTFVRLKVEDEGLVKDKLAAWACVRLDRLQPGYRFIDLKDARGDPCAGKLLVKIDKVVQ